jgi:hypothetical protein
LKGEERTPSAREECTRIFAPGEELQTDIPSPSRGGVDSLQEEVAHGYSLPFKGRARGYFPTRGEECARIFAPGEELQTDIPFPSRGGVDSLQEEVADGYSFPFKRRS